MKNKLENWLLNVFAGKLVARGAVTIAAWVAGPVVAAIAAKTGVNLHVDQSEISGALVIGAHSLFEWFKARRMANPASPAVQTDPAKIVPVVPPAAN